MFYRLWHLSPLRVTFTKLEKQPREKKKKKGPKYTFLTFNNVKQMALFLLHETNQPMNPTYFNSQKLRSNLLRDKGGTKDGHSYHHLHKKLD